MSTIEPDFWRQSAEPLADADARFKWFSDAALAMNEQGATFFQMSVHPDIEHLRLIEGWKEKPPGGDCGAPRWALVLA